MQETTDTTPRFPITPIGRKVFFIPEGAVPKKMKSDAGNIYFVFNFHYNEDGITKAHKETLMAWQIGPLLEALGFKADPANPKQYTWDRELCPGKGVEATIIHEQDRKDKDKKYARMTDIKPSEIPF